MPQQSLSEFVQAMEKAGLLVRIKEEKRVDELPQVMEANPLKAVLVERVKDCEFQFLTNAYSMGDGLRKKRDRAQDDGAGKAARKVGGG